jgi:hypothetical protein
MLELAGPGTALRGRSSTFYFGYGQGEGASPAATQAR